MVRSTGRAPRLGLYAVENSGEGLWSDQASGSSGAGSYVFLQSLTASGIAGKTLTITGALGVGCGAVPLQIVVDSSGSTFTANCEGSSQSQGSGSIGTVASIPGVITLNDTGGGTSNLIDLRAADVLFLSRIAANVTGGALIPDWKRLAEQSYQKSASRREPTARQATA